MSDVGWDGELPQDTAAAIAQVRDGLTALTQLPVPGCGDVALEEADSLLVLRDLLDTVIDDRVGVVESTKAHKLVGYGTVSTWLRRDGRMNTRSSATRARNGRQMQQVPEVAAEVLAGQVSYAAGSIIHQACADLQQKLARATRRDEHGELVPVDVEAECRDLPRVLWR